MSRGLPFERWGTPIAIREKDARHYGLQLHPFRKSPFAGVVHVENVWIEAPLDADNRWLVAYRVVVQEGRAVVAELRVFPNEPEHKNPGEWSAEWVGRHAVVPAGGLSTRGLRSIRIGREMHSLKALIDRAKGHIDTRWMLSAEHGTYGQFGITEELGTAPIRAATNRGRPQKPLGVYVDVAVAYVKAIEGGSHNPVQDVARVLGLPVTTVRSRIHAARNRGLLDRGRQGYAGGQLLPAAKAVPRRRKVYDMAKRRGRGEGSITQRGDGRWMARVDLGWDDGGRKYKAVYGKTRREVAGKLTKVLREVQQGTALPDERQTVAQFLERWLEHKRGNLRSRAWLTYEQAVRLHYSTWHRQSATRTPDASAGRSLVPQTSRGRRERSEHSVRSDGLSSGFESSAQVAHGDGQRGRPGRSAAPRRARDSAAHA